MANQAAYAGVHQAHLLRRAFHDRVTERDLAVSADRDAIAKRQICLLKAELVDNPTSLDYANLPKDAKFTCITPDENQTLQTSLMGKP